MMHITNKKICTFLLIVFAFAAAIAAYAFTHTLFHSDHEIIFDPSESLAVANPEAKFKDYGSAKVLVGKCVFINIFLSDPESNVTEADKEAVLENMKAATEFLQRKAGEHRKELEIVYGEDDLVFDITWASSIAFQLQEPYWATAVVNNFIGEGELKKITEKYGTDNLGFVISLNKDGPAYSIPVSAEYSELYYNEPCVIGTSEEAFIYAHEIMHLFGAKDLYYPDNPGDKRIKLAAEYFPNDLMVKYSSDLSEVTICDIDAYLVGWDYYILKEHLIFMD